MKTTPKIIEYMTVVPKTIGCGLSVSKASEIMRAYNVRHLPVLKDGQILGIISDRDIKTANFFPGPGELSVEDVMTSNPFIVGPDAFLDEVASEMIARKFGCAVVQAPSGKVIGIFSTIDALMALKDELQRNYLHKAA